MEKVVSVLDPEVPKTVVGQGVQAPPPQVQGQQEGKKILRSFSQQSSAKKKVYVYLILGLVVVLAGGLTGKTLAGRGGEKTSTGAEVVTKNGEVAEAGLPEDEFTDEPAEGMLVAGGMDDEGTHHLDRGMGPEKDVYLFSTSLDLSKFEGKKVKVWGHSLTSKNVPWLMDVGRITVID